MPSINIKFKKDIFKIQISFERSVRDLFEYIGEVVALNKLHCRLIMEGKSYVPSDFDQEDEVASLISLDKIVKPNGTALLIVSSSEEVEKIKKFRSDPLVKGFADEERDEINRVKRTKQLEADNPWGSGNDQHQEFRFDKLEILFRRVQPPPFEAEKLLKKLVTDPGILDIMRRKRFTVGIFCELDPADADMEQAAKGEGDKCLLGWNKNFGQRIALRLRTDDFQSFRKYHSIVNTLIHELTHNIVSPHDEKFWTTFNELKEIYSHVHASRKSARPLSMSLQAAAIPVKNDSASPLNGKLGGKKIPPGIASVRDARISAFEPDSK